MQDSSSSAPARVSARALTSFTEGVFVACGLPVEDARTVAAAMVEADLTGVDTHGVTRLAQYVPLLQERRINPKPRVQLAERGPATAVVDGDNGMGHLVMTFAAQHAIALAKESGVAWVGSRRSNHAGAAAVYAAMMLDHGMVGIYGAASGSNLMPVSGGAEPLLGTNPIAVAIPAADEAPVVLDIATSIASFGLIRKHAIEGKPIPEGWVVSRTDGRPITDPQQAPQGLLLPIGGYKGSGLALIIGLLAGPLNRAAFGRDVRDFGTPGAGESNTGQFIIAVDVARFLPLEAFKAEIDRHVRALRASARLPGVEEIHVPGEGRRKRREQALREGVPLSPAVRKQLDAVAASLQIAPLGERT